MFADITEKVSEVISVSTNANKASHDIAAIVASETVTRSKTMLEDMYAYLSKQALSTSEFTDINKQNKFYEADLRNEIFTKYRFEASKKVNFNEANSTLGSLAAAGGTAAVGGILIFALSPTNLVIPIGLIVAASVAAFCVSYFAVAPSDNKKKFEEAVKTFLEEMKHDFLAWFDEVERYFEKRVAEIKKSF